MISQYVSNTLEYVLPHSSTNDLYQAIENGWKIDTTTCYCNRCGASIGPGAASLNGCAFCVDQSVPWVRLVRLHAYKEPVNSWIISMKFAGAWPWATWFGDRLADLIDDATTEDRVAVCPVPMHWLRYLQRRYNQAQLIATRIAISRRWPLVQMLRRIRNTPPQTTIQVSRRVANVHQAFMGKAIDLTGWDVWLIDDVKTTGATLAACTRLLRGAGANNVRVAVVAVADPHGTDFTRI